jgi:PAS domain S-box-containing protein
MLPDFRVRQRDFLLEISRAITAQLDLDEVLKRVLNASLVMLAGEVGMIALQEDEAYRIRASLGIDSALLPTLNQQLHGLFEVADNDQLTEKLRLMANSVHSDLQQSVALPLVFAREMLGLLVVFRTFRDTPTPNDLQVLQSFADQAAIAVNNAQMYAKIDQERKRLAAILEFSGDGVMFLDAHQAILRFNRALERLTGWRAQDAIGRQQDEVLRWKRVEKNNLRDALANGWPYTAAADSPAQILYIEGDLLRLDGLTLSVGITYAPLFNAEGKLANIIANARDITNFRQAQEMQNVFVSTVSHELKTPVALIKGYAGTLRRDDVTWDPTVINNGLQVIEEEADRLNELIENLLATSTLQAERMKLDVEDVWLQRIAANTVERFRIQTKKHTLKLNFPKDYPMIRGDAVRLRQLIDNLVNNAIKYSPDGGLVEVGGTFDQHHVTVYVRDEGVGIPEADQERIFERFYRIDGTLARKTQGTGLGLYLAKAIVEAHGGRIHVESRAGEGSTFIMTLPQDVDSRS